MTQVYQLSPRLSAIVAAASPKGLKDLNGSQIYWDLDEEAITSSGRLRLYPTTEPQYARTLRRADLDDIEVDLGDDWVVELPTVSWVFLVHLGYYPDYTSLRGEFVLASEIPRIQEEISTQLETLKKRPQKAGNEP